MSPTEKLLEDLLAARKAALKRRDLREAARLLERFEEITALVQG